LKIDKTQLKIIIPVALGIFFIFFSIIADPAFKTTVINAENADTNVTGVKSSTEFDKAFALSVEVVEGKRLYIEFSIHEENMSVAIVILGKGTYDTLKTQNTTAPTALSGNEALNFVTYTPQMGGAVVGTPTDEVMFQYDGFIRLEFGGSTVGDSVITIPGDYVILVYGTNNWANDPDTNISFGLKVTTEGPWRAIETTFAILAFIALAIAGIIALMEYRPSLFGGVEE
jgi:hypothetical protein